MRKRSTDKTGGQGKASAAGAPPAKKAARSRKDGGPAVRPSRRKPAGETIERLAAVPQPIAEAMPPVPAAVPAPAAAAPSTSGGSGPSAPAAIAAVPMPSADAGTFSRRTASFAMLVGAIVLAPAPFGSRDGASIAFWCAWLSAGIMIAPSAGLTRRVAAWLCGVAIMIFAWLFVLHEQMGANPFLASEHPLWRQAAMLLDTPLQGAVGVQRNQGFYALGAPMAALLAFVLGLLACGGERQREQLARALGYSVAAYAAFGLASLILDPGMLLWRERVAYIGAVTGTFVNSNTAADYFTAGAIAWLALLIRHQMRGGRGAPRTARDDWRWRLRKRDVPVIAAGLCCMLAVILTRSRLGVALSGLALAGTYLVLDRRPGRLLRRLAVIALVAAGLLQLVGAALFARFDLLGLSDGGRLETYRNTLRLILDHRWFGVGLGSFGAAYPAYRSDAGLWWTWDAAHSTPLELAAEMGLPLAGLMMLCWLVLLVALAGRFLRSQETLTAIAFPIVLVGALHSLVDFSLQTAGYAIPVMALAGAALRADPRPARRGESDGPPPG